MGFSTSLQPTETIRGRKQNYVCYLLTPSGENREKQTLLKEKVQNAFVIKYDPK